MKTGGTILIPILGLDDECVVFRIHEIPNVESGNRANNWMTLVVLLVVWLK